MKAINREGVEQNIVLNDDGSLPVGPSAGSGGGGGGYGTGVGVVAAVLDNTGAQVAVDSMAQTFTNYGPSGAMDTITATNGTHSWVQTLTYAGSVLTGISQWVRQ